MKSTTSRSIVHLPCFVTRLSASIREFYTSIFFFFLCLFLILIGVNRFEPPILGFARGLIAAYATLGLLGYTVFLVNSEESIASTTQSVHMSLTLVDKSGSDLSTGASYSFGSNTPQIYAVRDQSCLP